MPSKTTITTKKPKNSLKERLDIYNYDKQIEAIWNSIKKSQPEYLKIYQNYYDGLVNAAISKSARVNNLRALLSLGRIVKEKGYSWNHITRSQVNSIITYIMERWADAEGKETHHTAGQKKFLMQFVRWIKTGKRNHHKKVAEPEEIFDIEIKKVAQRITREDLLTDDEEMEILEGCGDNLRNRAMISLHMDAGDRAGETLNSRLGHFKFLDNGGVIFYVDGKTEDRPIHLLKCVPDLAAWFAVHPKKKDKYAPTWITSFGTNLKYAAARKIIKNAVDAAIAKKTKIGETSSLSNKRVFMTLMRKKEITTSHKWMSPQLSKKRHGWTPDSKVLSTYENLNQEDVEHAIWEHYGLELSSEDKKEKPMPKICFICKKLNPVGNESCNQCGKPLDLKTALEVEEKEEQKYLEISKKLDKTQDALKEFVEASFHVTRVIEDGTIYPTEDEIEKSKQLKKSILKKLGIES